MVNIKSGINNNETAGITIIFSKSPAPLIYPNPLIITGKVPSCAPKEVPIEPAMPRGDLNLIKSFLILFENRKIPPTEQTESWNPKENKLRQPKHVQISLADFNKDEVDANNENNNYSENAIERSILQQLFYSQKRYKLPKSSINRANKSSFWLTAGCALLSIIFILSVIVLSFEISGNSLFNVSNSSIVNSIASCVATISLVVAIICLARFGYLKQIIKN